MFILNIKNINNFLASGIVARISIWSILAFVFNLMWEISHVRLYTIWLSGDSSSIGLAALHCSLEDVVIAITMFLMANILLGENDWPLSRPFIGCVIVVIGAMIFTVWSEWYNVYFIKSWSYLGSMPTIYGIGISPLLQWLILPPIIVITYRWIIEKRLKKRKFLARSTTHSADV